MKGKFSLAVVVCLFLTLAAHAQNDFRLNEAATKAFIKSGELETQLVFENKSAALSANIRLEILDVNDKILAQSGAQETFRRGQQTVSISLPFSYAENSNDYLWYRLRYSVETADKSVGGGIVSLSEITPEIFEIRAAASERIYSGMNYRVRVRAFQLVTNAPARAVKIRGEVALELKTESETDELKIKASGITDKNGYALLDFIIPPNANLDDANVTITGEKNGVTREAEKDLYAPETEYSVFLNTDKPIYQPNQKLSVRGLFLRRGADGQATKALAGEELEFIVKDEDGTVLYRETVTTSRFGIASIGWQIPENAKLGDYRVELEANKDLSSNQIYFRVSRYDLPNFAVAVKPDKTFYLPGENTAEIVVSADYLFGKPVAKGTVKVVEEKSREWNYKEQKWTIEEEKSYTGETGADGKFVAQVDLTKAHADLSDTEYRKFEDLRFAAYFTDQTTNRTEQRRFDIRITKEAIHLYLVGIESYDDQNPSLPIQFYVSTFYADGAPAACVVSIEGKYKDEDKPQTLTRLETNSLGAGRVEFDAPKRADDIYVDDLQIKVTAVDANGRRGTHEEEIEIDADEKQIRLFTDKAIYRTGEPIKIKIISTEKDADAFVDIVRNLAIVESRTVRLRNGRAEIVIPYNPEFVNQLTVAAYIDDDGDEIETSRGVTYPRPTNLRLDAAPAQNSYRPNEEAKINFSVSSAGKKSTEETALGVVVFDRAIEERARTDADFGDSPLNQFGAYSSLLDGDTTELDLTKPVSKDVQLRAELVLSSAQFNLSSFESDEYKTNLKSVFIKHFDRQFLPIEAALKSVYATNFEHPIDENSLRQILSEKGIDFVALRDPWGNDYKAFFTVEREESVLTIRSAGANKSFDDADDFALLQMRFKYFTRIGQAIDRSVANYHQATKRFVRDYETLRNELKKQNIDLDALRDRWNNSYLIEFGVSGRFYTISLTSGGADGKTDDLYNNFTVWTNRTDYFAETETRLQTILSNYATERKSFPKDENEFKVILKNGDVDFDGLRDGWNRPLKLKLETFSRYADRMKTESVAIYGEQAKEKTTITPVTQQIAVFRVQNAGADGAFGNYDDVTLTTFSGVISEQTKADAKPIELKTETIFTGGKGAVRGTITDPTGAVVPGVKMTATNEETKAEFEANSNEDGVYILKNLPSGKYTIRTSAAAGFSTSTVENVPVRSSTLTELNFTLNVGGVSSVVEVTSSGGDSVNSTSSSISTSQIQALPINGRRFSELALLKPGVSESKKVEKTNKDAATVLEEKSTPRLREFFPETLVWQPELITDKNGKAELKFRLGDNITTWKLYAIASNAKGEIGIAQQEIKAFQPFFVDLEPPKFLTVGDEISLPVQVRNYTDAKQNVAVEMTKAGWFDFTNQPTQQIEVAPNNSQNAVFGFKANAVIKDGKQRVTAIADKDSDAIEKPVTVRPNGEEIVQTKSEIFRESVSFDVDFPANALPQTQKAELKIYPNLLAHVAESIEGLLQRPYGCGEQTISSTYPNLMVLKFAPKEGKLRAQATNYLQKGYERLLSYQQANGGFSVWAQDAPDVALTAYALRFLTDADEFIETDEDVIKRARMWLIKQQRADGSWTRQYNWEKTEDRQRTKLMTSYAARTLAMIEKASKDKEAQTALRRGLEFLKTRNEEIDEPYALALFGLASLDAGNLDDAKAIAQKLESMAMQENAGAYWNLETNTPFYGWGTAGRIETTALVVQLLLKVQSSKFQVSSQAESQPSNLKSQSDGQTANLISKSTQFLLKNKDRYGVWYSTQTTINVLDTFLAAIGDVANGTNENRAAEVFVNGRKYKDVTLPPENALTFPVVFDLPVNESANRIEIKIGGNKSATMAQIVGTHYLAWQDYQANGRTENQSRALRLAYDCDKKTAKPTEEISCTVETERIGFKGYGMLLAEIGLPPGADVDRASLEKAKQGNWSFSRYDILPDRIIVYLWAQAGGTKFNFKFKPRYGINAQTPSSIVYDYYNAEAQATLPPMKFSVK